MQPSAMRVELNGVDAAGADDPLAVSHEHFKFQFSDRNTTFYCSVRNNDSPLLIVLPPAV